jgi:hypothetical protein
MRAQPKNQATGRTAVKEMVAHAMAERHASDIAERPKWYFHLLAKADAKADKIASAAAQGAYSNGEATWAEVYSKQLPALLMAALERLDNPEPD